MTGKEALKLAQDTILANNGNNKSSFTMKNLYLVEEELNEKDKKLTKYKRVFEILKQVKYTKQSASKCLGLTQINIETEQFVITNEEKELLEELMNCGTKDN